MTGVVKGISEHDFQQWRHNPVTKVFRAYLTDYADALGKALFNQFMLSGELGDAAQRETRGRILASHEASELEFESIRKFYEEANEPETSQDRTGSV